MSMPSSIPNTAKILLDSPPNGPALGFGRTAEALARIITASDPRFAIGIFGGLGVRQDNLDRSHRTAAQLRHCRNPHVQRLAVRARTAVACAAHRHHSRCPVRWSRNGDAEARERVSRVARRIAKGGPSVGHDGVLGDLGVIDLPEMRRNVAGGQTAGIQRQHDLIDVGQPPLPLGHKSPARSCRRRPWAPRWRPHRSQSEEERV
jgi:hypothetical protein